MLSVLMPFYNSEKSIEKAIDSILKQTFRDFSLYLIDDCSEDNSLSIAENKKKTDSRIIIIKNIEKLGISKSLNALIPKLHTKYIVRMDADDYSYEERFHEQINFLESNQETDILGTNVDYFDIQGNFISSSNLPLTDNLIKKQLSKNNVLIHPSIMMKTNFLKEIKGYNNFFINAQDYDLWFRARKKFNFTNLKKPLLRYQIIQKKSIKNDFYGILARIKNLSVDRYFLTQFFWIFISLILIFLRRIGFKQSIFRKTIK